MNTFIGVKMVSAEPMTDAAFMEHKGEHIDPSDPQDGYLVVYPDGYESWCPKDVFESANLKFYGNSAVTKADVDAFITSVDVKTYGDKTTVVIAHLANGYIITESSSCVDPENYDESVGRDICMDKIEDKVWFLLGFLLQSAKAGFRGVKK